MSDELISCEAVKQEDGSYLMVIKLKQRGDSFSNPHSFDIVAKDKGDKCEGSEHINEATAKVTINFEKEDLHPPEFGELLYTAEIVNNVDQVKFLLLEN